VAHGGGETLLRNEDVMTDYTHDSRKSSAWRRHTAVILSCLTLAVGNLSAEAASFTSPEQAVDALAAAWHRGNATGLIKVLGPASEKLVHSGDPVEEKRAWEHLASSYDKEHRIETMGDKATLVIGDDQWPYPIPLIRQGGGWRFDVKAGAEEILNRRIGRNELNVIKVCHAYVEAQHDYAARDHSGNGLHEYAQKMASSTGKHDGLYWPASGEEISPLGPLVASAEAQGYSAASAEGKLPFHGYFYRILTQQGRTISGPARDYVIDGHMTGGFALIAYPARYADSGVMSFLVNQDGVIFEKNLGPDSAAEAQRMTAYSPDASWKVVSP
jgi:hypothetical protein